MSAKKSPLINLSINYIVIRSKRPKYAEAWTIFKNAASLRFALSEKNTEAIYKFFHYKHLSRYILNICKYLLYS